MKRLAHQFATLSLALVLCAATGLAHAATAMLTIEANRPGHQISPTLFGIFFEDINCSADGGLYAEMVRNRNFEDSSKPDNWTTESSGGAVVVMTLDSSKPASQKN